MSALGPYAVPVIAAYLVSAVLLVGVVVQSVIASRRARRALERQERRHG